MFTRKPGWSSLLVAALFLGLTTVATITAAQDRDSDPGRPRECSLKTLQGRFGYFAQGTVLAVPSVHPALPLVVSGIFTYDGEGNVSGTYNQSVGGGISTGLTAEGTYLVKSDCTYSAQLNTPNGVVHRVGTITGEGMRQEIHVLFTDPSSVAYATLKKTPEWCSLETLKGAYALFGQGTILPPAPASPLSDATAGRLTFDGEGNFSGDDTANINGTSTAVTFYGTYAVTPECAVSAHIIASNGHVLDEEGSITGEGDSKEIHDIFVTLGWAFTDTLKKQ